jgi:hypothetical protein
MSINDELYKEAFRRKMRLQILAKNNVSLPYSFLDYSWNSS